MMNAKGEWYVVAQVFLFGLIALGPAWIDVELDLPERARQAGLLVGVMLSSAGLGLTTLAVLWLGDNLSVLPHPKDRATLVRSGPYALARHPIYSGLILGAVGWALIHASVMTLIYAVILFVFFDAKSRREERYLARQFPEYADYQQRVRKLIPFVY
jgi:protein-S-isoprenylcysteine O-methyltransferase Ste14